MCAVKTRILFLSCSGGATGASITKVYKNAGKNWPVGLLERVYQTILFLPLISLFHFFRVGLAWCTVGFYWSSISTILEPHLHHKVSNNLIISNLMYDFYLQHPPSHKWCNPWDVECLLFLLGSWLSCGLFSYKL